MTFRPALLCALALSLLAPGFVARAASTAPISTARSTARLVSDTDAVAPGTPFHVALELTPAPGWHAYWHNPGDAGAAPEVDLTLPLGAAAGPIAWPLPQRIADGSVMSFGYTTKVLLARAVTLQSPGPLTLTAHANWLVCAQLCVPESASFTLTLPPGTPAPSAEASTFAADLPRLATFPAHIAPDGTLWMTGAPAFSVQGSAQPAVFLPDASDTTVLGAPQRLRRQGDTLSLKLTPTANFHPDQPMPGLLILGAGDQRTGYTLTAQPAPLPGGAASPWAADAATLAFAVMGGLLLNLMPCVFPILAMKAIGLAHLTGAARRTVRLHALSYTAGVLLSFLALAGLFLALRAAGGAAGWGFQFQWPAFVAAMAWLFFAIGLNLSGAFTLGGSLAGAGDSLARRAGHAGSLATGFLAVLVATPCTAPFMGAAIAAAIAAPLALALALFLAMGLGLALPYLALAAWPALANLLPAPGRWMELLRQGLAFPMYAAAVWMAWVQSVQTGPTGVLVTGAGCVLIALGIWLLGTASASQRTGKSLARILALACLLGCLALLPGLARIAHAPSTAAQADAYTPARLQQLRDSGQPVLVNMTAAWCVTCLVNERAAIAPGLPVLAAHHVAYLTGDWTRQDPAITDFLRQYGRDGVPLYVYFAPGQPGRVLPQILTPGLIASLAE